MDDKNKNQIPESDSDIGEKGGMSESTVSPEEDNFPEMDSGDVDNE